MKGRIVDIRFDTKINDIDGTENITERFKLFRVWVENTYVGYQKSWELEEQETMMNVISEKDFFGIAYVSGDAGRLERYQL